MKKARVWVHAQRRSGGPFESEGLRDFSRSPVAGDHFVLDGPTGDRFRVTLVVHLLFPDADSDMEVYAIKVDDKEMFEGAKNPLFPAG